MGLSIRSLGKLLSRGLSVRFGIVGKKHHENRKERIEAAMGCVEYWGRIGGWKTASILRLGGIGPSSLTNLRRAYKKPVFGRTFFLSLVRKDGKQKTKAASLENTCTDT